MGAKLGLSFWGRKQAEGVEEIWTQKGGRWIMEKTV
jgi:hypothetical protein